jgi:hypothetical protein
LEAARVLVSKLNAACLFGILNRFRVAKDQFQRIA